jgi:predicted metal-dependent HD superfamily phosphohydrolase
MTSAERIARALIEKVGMDRTKYLTPVLLAASIGDERIYRTFHRMQAMLDSPSAHRLLGRNEAPSREMTARTSR